MEAALVLVIAGATILVLATERLSPEVTGLLVMVALVLTGVLDATSAFAGLASPAILMIAGVMLMTGALVHNGVPQRIVRAVRGLSGRSERRAGVLLIAAVNALSAFINNVAATAMFVPVAEGLASTFGSDRRRWLMPVAFASMTGGTCTLIGTSTNVAVSGALPALGLSPLSFFELTPLGLVVAAVGLLYLVTVGQRTIAAARTPEAPRDEVREFLFEVRLGREAPVVGRDVEAADLQDRYGLTLLAIVRGDRQLDEPAPSEILRGGDLLLVKSRLERITELSALPGFRVVSMPMQQREALFGDPPRFAEATVSHDSPLVGRTLEEADFRHHFGVTVLAVYRRHELIARKVGKIRLHAGDVLLLYGRPDLVEGLGDGEARLLVAGVVGAPAGAPRALASAAVFLGAIVAAVTGWLDAPTAFLGGGALVVALGCLPARLAGGYAHVRFLVMLAGLISLGVAME
ncbi:MAG: SLC13 family permease, partial [Gemmatimonadota bacterium]